MKEVARSDQIFFFFIELDPSLEWTLAQENKHQFTKAVSPVKKGRKFVACIHSTLVRATSIRRYFPGLAKLRFLEEMRRALVLNNVALKFMIYRISGFTKNE